MDNRRNLGLTQIDSFIDLLKAAVAIAWPLEVGRCKWNCSGAYNTELSHLERQAVDVGREGSVGV